MTVKVNSLYPFTTFEKLGSQVFTQDLSEVMIYTLSAFQKKSIF